MPSFLMPRGERRKGAYILTGNEHSSQLTKYTVVIFLLFKTPYQLSLNRLLMVIKQEGKCKGTKKLDVMLALGIDFPSMMYMCYIVHTQKFRHFLKMPNRLTFSR